MPLPSPVFSSVLSSVLSISCQSTEHGFSPIEVNRNLLASGPFMLWVLRELPLCCMWGQFPVQPCPGSILLSGSEEKQQHLAESQMKGNGPLTSKIQSQG